MEDHLGSIALLRRVRGSEQVAAALRDVAFPISKLDLIARLEDRALDVDGELSAPLSLLVEGVALGRFEDAAQAQHALDARWARFSRALAAVDEREKRWRR